MPIPVSFTRFCSKSPAGLLFWLLSLLLAVDLVLQNQIKLLAYNASAAEGSWLAINGERLLFRWPPQEPLPGSDYCPINQDLTISFKLDLVFDYMLFTLNLYSPKPVIHIE
jgi:hypothetical protein